jgi:tetratricopeptide (TPR) repeat protein
MLSGSVRRAGDKVRLSAELADCESGTAIWSDRFAGEADDLFELQDELSVRVVATIAPQVQEAELRRVLRKPPENLDAYECVLRGLDLLYRFDDLTFKQTLPLFERAMALDPTYATAHALAATWHNVRFDQCWSLDPLADVQEAQRLSTLALTLDRLNPLALALCGHIRSFLFHDFDHAIELFDRALAASPSSAIAWQRSSPTFSYIGETREARRRANIGLRLSPYDVHVYLQLRRRCALQLRGRRLCRCSPMGAPVGGAQPALHPHVALPLGQPRGQRPDRRGAQSRPRPLALPSQVQRNAPPKAMLSRIPPNAGCSANISCRLVFPSSSAAFHDRCFEIINHSRQDAGLLCLRPVRAGNRHAPHVRIVTRRVSRPLPPLQQTVIREVFDCLG